MEAMDIFLATTKELSHLVLNHPLYAALGSVLCFAVMLKFYTRLTLGLCDCQEDMTGKTVLITGASAGIGRATALDLAKRNARLVLCCRNVDKGERVAREIRRESGNDLVVVRQLDLASFESVRRCARQVLDTEDKLHVLINNAGITGVSHEITEDGCEKIMQSNHFGHFLFTLLLLDRLKSSAPSRIINVASGAYKSAKFDVEDLGNSRLQPRLTVYSNSKLANVLFTTELARRLSGTGVTVNAAHPGFVQTDIFKDEKSTFLVMMIRIIYLLVAKSSEEGAHTSIHVAVSGELEKVTGRYFADCKEEPLREQARNRALAKRLFEASEKVVGMSYPET